MSPVEVETGRKLSHVRIHVERVIGLLKQKYTIFQSTLPISLIMCDDDTKTSFIDKIAVICCALCNCCQSVVPYCILFININILWTFKHIILYNSC